jgi:hypothetical protein
MPQPVPHLPPHERSHVGALPVWGFGAELHVYHIRVTQLTKSVHNWTSHSRSIDEEHGDFASVVTAAEDVGSEGNKSHTVSGLLSGDANCWDASCILTAAKAENALIGATSGDVQSSHQGIISEPSNVPSLRSRYALTVNELEI